MEAIKSCLTKRVSVKVRKISLSDLDNGMKTSKRRRVDPRKNEEIYNGLYPTLSGDSNLPKDKVGVHYDLVSHKTVSSLKDGQLKRALGNELERSIKSTCGIVQNSIRLKDVRIVQLEKELEKESIMKTEGKVAIGNLENKLSLEQKRIKELEQKTETMKGIIMASREMVQEQCLKDQELKIVKEKLKLANEEIVSVAAVNKELHLEIEKLQNNRDSVGEKNLGDKRAVQAELDKAVKDLHNHKYELECQKKNLELRDEELKMCSSNIKELEIGYREIKSIHDECEEKEYKWMEELIMADENVNELNKQIFKHEEALITMKKNEVEIQSLLREKTEYLSDLQTTLQSLEIKEGRKAATRQVDKMIIKQKIEEIEELKKKLCQFEERQSESNSVDIVNSIDETEASEELHPVAEQVKDGNYEDDSDSGDSDASTVNLEIDLEISPSTTLTDDVTLIDDVIPLNSSIALEADLFASIDKATKQFRDYRRSSSREEGDKTSVVDKGSDVVGNIIDVMDLNRRPEYLSMPSTSGQGKVKSSKKTIEAKTVPDKPPLPETSYPPLPPPPRSDSPAQTSQKTNGIRLKDINTLSSFFYKPDFLNEVFIPSSVDNIKDTVSVDMDIVSEEEYDILALAEKEKKAKQTLAQTEFKHVVAEVVKTCLLGFYPRQTKGIEKSCVIKSDQEFAHLAEKFSKQFREEVMSEHASIGNVGLEGLILTSNHKKVMLEQIIFYFSVREEVHKRLKGLVKPTNSKFQSCLSRYSESLTVELTDSHVTMGGSPMDLVMTDDSRLYIRCQVERRWRSDL